MLTFWLDAPDGEDMRDRAYALFEIGCRIGAPFTIVRSADQLPGDGFVIRYGEGTAAVPVGLELPRIDRGTCGPRRLVERTLWAGGDDARIDIVRGVAELVSATAERTVAAEHRGPGGSFEPHHHPLGALLTTPLVEVAAAHIRAQIAAQGGTIGPPREPWGRGKRYACIVTHDIDGPQLHSNFALLRSAIHALRSGKRGEGEAFQLGLVGRLLRAHDPYWNFADWLRLEALYGVRSTFYLYLARAGGAPRHPRDPHYDFRAPPFAETLRAAQASGAEFGVHYGIRSHGTAHYRAAREALEALLGIAGAPIGGRAHYWAIDWHDPRRSWRALDAAGYAHDASLSPMGPGFRLGSALPLSPMFGERDQPASGIVAVPTSVMDHYVSEAEFGATADERIARMDTVIDSVRDVGGMVVLDWHERTLANRGPWRGYLYPFLRCMDRVTADGSAAMLTMGEAVSAWRAQVAHCYRPTAGAIR